MEADGICPTNVRDNLVKNVYGIAHCVIGYCLFATAAPEGSTPGGAGVQMERTSPTEVRVHGCFPL